MKKIYKGILVISTLVIMIGIISILGNKFVHTKYSDFDSCDTQMFEHLSRIYNTFSNESENLWSSNYKINDKPIILIRSNKDKGIIRKHAYAINVKGLEHSVFAKKVDVPKEFNLPDVYRISNLDSKLYSTFFPSNFGVLDINKNDTFYFKYHPKMMENPDLYFDFDSFFLHESFHTYKQKYWTYDKDDGEYIKNYPENKEYYALVGLEFKLLDKCIESKSADDAKKYLEQLITIKTYKYKKWPQLIAETNTEAIEGTARYIEYKYSNLIGGNLKILPVSEDPYYVTFSYVFNCVAEDKVNSSYLKRSAKYETGAALGLIMDKADISWKEDMDDGNNKDGKTQYEILSKYFNISPDNISEDIVKEIQNENSYNELLNKGQIIVNIISKTINKQ